MATLPGNLSNAGVLRLRETMPPTLQAPMLGLAWVLVNVGLGWLGLAIGHIGGCLVAAGALDGSVLSVILVTRASEKFQGGIAGAFGGLGLDHLADGQTLIAKTAQGIHAVVDSLLAGMSGTDNEQVHKAIEQAAIQGVWTAIIVVLAALIAKWVQDSSH
jgi:hypothetical protein